MLSPNDVLDCRHIPTQLWVVLEKISKFISKSTMKTAGFIHIMLITLILQGNIDKLALAGMYY